MFSGLFFLWPRIAGTDQCAANCYSLAVPTAAKPISACMYNTLRPLLFSPAFTINFHAVYARSCLCGYIVIDFCNNACLISCANLCTLCSHLTALVVVIYGLVQGLTNLL